MTTRNKQDGGSAFPVWDSTAMHRIGMAASQDIEDSAERDREYIRATAQAAEGMTLRDYFAATAVQGMCAHPDTWGMGTDGLALKAYQLADAMLKARGCDK